MSMASATVAATWANNRTLDDLRTAIVARQKYLRGATTETAVKATAINVLISLRAETLVAPKKDAHLIADKWRWEIEATGYTAGWAYPPRNHKHGRRVIRQGGERGHALDKDPQTGKRIVNLAGSWRKGENPRVIRVKIYELPNGKPFYNSLMIANDDRDALLRFIYKRIVRRIGQYRGISKKLLGIAMHKIATGKGEAPSGELGELCADYAVVSMRGSGYGSGSFGVSFLDKIYNSAQTLKHGAASVGIAMNRAARRTIAIINKTALKPLDVPAELSFDEIAQARGA